MVKQQGIIIIILSIIYVLLLMIYTYLQDNLFTTSVDYNATESQIKALQQQNMQLHDQLLEESSYTSIYQKAINAGFVRAEIMYL